MDFDIDDLSDRLFKSERAEKRLREDLSRSSAEIKNLQGFTTADRNKAQADLKRVTDIMSSHVATARRERDASNQSVVSLKRQVLETEQSKATQAERYDDFIANLQAAMKKEEQIEIEIERLETRINDYLTRTERRLRSDLVQLLEMARQKRGSAEAGCGGTQAQAQH